MTQFIGIDVGGTKTAWGLFDLEGNLLKSGQKPTPDSKEDFLKLITSIPKNNEIEAIGIGIAGTISADHMDTLVCPNIPSLSHFELVEFMEETTGKPVSIDNDARCALIGEVWKGAAQNMTNAVMLTLGTGVGGAVMQKGRILPHPIDLNQEFSHLIIDPSDMFPAASGAGSLEALLGGRNLEDRYEVSLADVSLRAHQGDKAALKIWSNISELFVKSIQVIENIYGCRNIIIGGKGSKDLDLYLNGFNPPCPVLVAELGEKAGIYGAARLAIDLYEEQLEKAKAEEEWE